MTHRKTESDRIPVALYILATKKAYCAKSCQVGNRKGEGETLAWTA